MIFDQIIAENAVRLSLLLSQHHAEEIGGLWLWLWVGFSPLNHGAHKVDQGFSGFVASPKGRQERSPFHQTIEAVKEGFVETLEFGF